MSEIQCVMVLKRQECFLLVDERKDLSKKEQVSIVLRYVDSKGMHAS